MKNSFLIQLELVNGKKGEPIEFKVHNDNFFLQNLGKDILDLHLFGIAIFEVEKRVVHNPKIKKVTLPHTSNLTDKEKTELSKLLNHLFLFLYSRNVSFTFEKTKFQVPKRDNPIQRRDYDSVLLFSGGLDSTMGINYCKSHFNKTLLVYSRHATAGQLTPLIDRLENKIIRPKGLTLIRIASPKQERGYFANTRGLLYLLNGALFACANNSSLIISECGVTMYQPRFGPLYKVTYTTHPAIITIGKEIIKIITNKDIDIQLPFENNTKTEMIKKYGDVGGIALSFSCLTQSFANTRGNCGVCYACLIRRLGILAAQDDPTVYAQQDDLANIRKIKEKLYPLVDFCYRVLTDFDGLDYWQRERILKYGKKDLFQRFSHDTFVSLNKLSKSQKLPLWLNSYLKAIEEAT